MIKCSNPDCDRPKRSRGMCAYHYLKWLRSDAPKPKTKTARELILERMPGSAKELGVRAGVSKDKASMVCKELYAEGLIHIGELRSQGARGGHYVRIWVAGPGEDATVTKAQKKDIRRKLARDSYRVRKARRTPSTWFSALGVPP